MILPDVNVLIYAFRVDARQHGAYAQWLAAAVSREEEIALHDSVLAGVVRVTTNPRVSVTPTSPAAAAGFVRWLRNAPGARWVSSGTATWEVFDRLVADDPGIRGNLVPDAHLAAAAIAHGARLATADRGFARFPGLRFFDPAAPT